MPLTLTFDENKCRRFLALEKAAHEATSKREAVEKLLVAATTSYNQAKTNLATKMVSYESLGPLHATLLRLQDEAADAANQENARKNELSNAERPMKDELFQAMRKAAGG